MTSGGFSESEVSHRHNDSELPICCHCRFNTRTVVLYPFLLGSRCHSSFRSFCLFCFSLPCLAILFSKGPRPVLPLFCSTHGPPNNSQSHQLSRNIIVLRPRAFGPTTGPHHPLPRLSPFPFCGCSVITLFIVLSSFICMT